MGTLLENNLKVNQNGQFDYIKPMKLKFILNHWT